MEQLYERYVLSLEKAEGPEPKDALLAAGNLLTKARWIQEVHFPKLQSGMLNAQKGAEAAIQFAYDEISANKNNPPPDTKEVREAFSERRLVALRSLWESNREFIKAAKVEMDSLR